MNSAIQILILAIAQGITEFLPISSSGHLVLMKALFGIESHGVGLELSLHFGTLIAIVVFYWRDIREILSGSFSNIVSRRSISHKTILYIVLASIPVAVVGVVFASKIERLFSRGDMVAMMLIITSFFLASTAIFKSGKKNINIPGASLIGIAQALAILPGISRSGITISTGKILGYESSETARFSFLIAIPAILGAIVFELIKEPASFELIYIPGIAVSAIVGYFSLKVLINTVKSNRLWIFAPYCFAIGLVSIFLM